MNKTLIASLIPILLTQSVNGATTIHQYGGTINTITSNVGGILGLISISDSVSGYFTFDPDGRISGDRYRAIIAISIGTREININSNYNYIRAQDNISVFGLGVVDSFGHGFDSIGPTSNLSPLYVYELVVEFFDTSASVYDGATPLPVDLNLSVYNVARWRIKGSDLATRTQNFQVSGVITSVSVPEPTTFLMLALGTAGMLTARRRTKGESGPRE